MTTAQRNEIAAAFATDTNELKLIDVATTTFRTNDTTTDDVENEYCDMLLLTM